MDGNGFLSVTVVYTEIKQPLSSMFLSQKSLPDRWSLSVFALSIWALTTASIACTGNHVVTGRVISVFPKSITIVEKITVVDIDGHHWTFESDGEYSGFTPSHLLEHQVAGDPIKIKYRELAGKLLIITIQDG